MLYALCDRALSFLRTGMGLQTTPANLVLVSLALFMTFYVMAPTFDKAWQDGIRPLIENKISEQEAYTVHAPFRDVHARQRPRQGSAPLRGHGAARRPAISGSREADEVEMRVLIPAFMISELQTRVRDRISDRPAVSGHRSHRRDADDVDGYDDVAADGYFAAFQDFVLRSDRRLESSGGADPLVCLALSLRVKRYATFFA